MNKSQTMVGLIEKMVGQHCTVQKAICACFFVTLTTVTASPLLAMDLPFSSNPMSMPSYGSVPKVADNGGSETEMGKRFGKFMEGFSQQMVAPREGANQTRGSVEEPARGYGEDRGSYGREDLGSYGREDRGSYGREDRGSYGREDRGSYGREGRGGYATEGRRGGTDERRDYRYQDRRDYSDPVNQDRRTDNYYKENPYRYDPWGARYWGHQNNPYEQWGGYGGGYGGGDNWGYRQYPYAEGGYLGAGDPYGSGYGSGYGTPPYAPDYYGGYDPAYQGGRRYYPNRGRGYGDSSLSMSFDNPWDSFWPRQWPFAGRSWDW